jgi:transcriptional regulator with XRE-family HTH domain
MPYEKTEIGEYIKALRTNKNYTQRELGRLSGVSHSEIARIEKGEKIKPTAKILTKLAPVLGVSPEKLMAVAGWVRRHEIIAAHDPNSYYGITPEIEDCIRREVEKAWEEAENKRKE